MRGGVACLLVSLVACEPAPSPAPAADPEVDVDHAVARLRAFEQRERAATDFEKLPSASRALGADPYALVPLSGDRAVGILRGDDAVVLYDSEMRRLASAPFPAPTGVAWCDGELLVVGELRTSIARFVVEDDTLVAREPLPIPGAVALRDVACGYAIDEATDTLYVLDEELRSQPTCAGPIDVEAQGGQAVVRCLIDHTVMIGERRIQHDGPIWSMALDGDIVAVAGVENRPLDRMQGFFGNIDSFVFIYRGGELVGQRNVSADGIVTPKTLRWQDGELEVTGYGSAGVLWLSPELEISRRGDGLPGAASVARFAGHTVMANPLLDAWVLDGQRVVSERAPGDPEQRLGEALAFTTLMAPHNRSDGAHSRFTCETCHFEGYGDGRTHHTGRGEVRASTKPLYGLFNNRPHFTRALDPDLTRVAHAEFRVAGKGSGHDPWFGLSRDEHPWLERLHERAQHSPEQLRRALMRFLMAFNHRENPIAHRTARFDAAAREGARLFAERCVSCHAARLSTDDESTEVPFEKWEALVLSGGAIVWARPGYEKTGVEPYVHHEGARPSSLRRLYRKRPLFTNGSVRTLPELLAQVRWTDEVFFHAHGPADASGFTGAEQKALVAFLRLL